MTIDSQCLLCKNFIDNGDYGCKAFKIIPEDILYNIIIHNKKLFGQKNNIIYTKKEGVTPITETINQVG